MTTKTKNSTPRKSANRIAVPQVPAATKPAKPPAKKRVKKATSHLGMGAILHDQGVAFRVWAPNADQVAVVGSFNDWNPDQHPMKREPSDCWYVDVPNAKVGDEYRFLIKNGDQELSRIDPYAREVTHSVGNGVIYDPAFDWEDDQYELPPQNEMVIYELHVGTFARVETEDGSPSTFKDVERRLDHLKRLGINVIEIMPSQEFAGDLSWGYNPAHIFAVESAYGGPNALKSFVRSAHKLGIGVVLDVVYNHFGPSDLHLWQFDGWNENGLGGIYFYNDWRSETPWGNTRPDYGRGEVRQFIRDNALMWIDEFHLDGLRYDATVYIRTVRGPCDPGCDLPEGWSLTQWVNDEIKRIKPNTLLVAEDLQNNEWLTKDTGIGGAGFDSQWDAAFVHPIRQAVIVAEDDHRSMGAVTDALLTRYDGDAFDRVIFSESHDEVANGKARVPYEIDASNADGWFAQKRSTLAAALTFTAPGIPMIFQGQEFLEGEWFRDDVPLDWDKADDFRGIVRLYRDLINLRLNRRHLTKGLTGQHIHVYRVDETGKILAFRRWYEGGPADDTVVIANFRNEHHASLPIGLPSPGIWKLRFNSDAAIYSSLFTNSGSKDLITEEGECDGLPYRADVDLGPYAVVIYSQDPGENPTDHLGATAEANKRADRAEQSDVGEKPATGHKPQAVFEHPLLPDRPTSGRVKKAPRKKK